MNHQKDDPVAAALERFFASFPSGPAGIESVGLLECHGRMLASDINAAIDYPSFSRALVEGFLINVIDTVNAGDSSAFFASLNASTAIERSEKSPVTLTIRGLIEPGQIYGGPLQAGCCMEVSTGSFVPEGDYAVARYMDIVKSEGIVSIKRPYNRGDNIENRGCEIKRGDLIIKHGTRLFAKEIMGLAGQGILTVDVAKRPRVAVFSSGNEVIPPSEKLRPGYIWDANSYSLSAQVEEFGGVPVFCGIMKDDFSTFENALKGGLQRADMVVISGGTAAGGREFIVELINSLGKPGVVVNGVPMRSGKPLIMGVIENKPIVCVAGYPPEAIRGFELFGKPAIERLLGICK